MVVNAALLKRALERDEIQPFFQPLRELSTGSLIGFELLARWNDPECGLVLPGNFIDVAEQSGLLTDLTVQILRKAFQAAPALPDPLRLSVNISPLQLKDVNLPTLFAEIAAEQSFPIHRLTIEITETALLDDFETAQESALRFKAIGCRLLLDDFGTGYSNLRHLQRLRFDGLKIDKSFVTDILESRESRKIVAALIGLGQSLGLTTVAEGIESAEQARLLLYLGCDVGQGWYYGRPTEAFHVGEVVCSPRPKLNAKWSITSSDPDLASLEALPTQRVAQLQAIYDGAPVGLCFLSRSLRYVSVNHQFVEINNTPAMEMLGQTVESMFPQWFPLYEPYLLRALKGEVLKGIEITRPGRKIGDADQTILISYAPAKDEVGEVVGISMALIDITEQKNDEEAVRTSEEKYRKMIDLHPHTPWVFDGHGNVLDVGAQWERITGYSHEATLGTGYLETIYADDRQRVLRSMRESIACKKDIDVQWRVKLPTGQLRWVRSQGKAILNSAGEVYRYYGITEDIEELVRLRRYKAGRERSYTKLALPAADQRVNTL